MGLDLDKAIEEKISGKRKRDEKIRELIGGKEDKETQIKETPKTLRACFVITQETRKLIDAMCIAESREKSAILNEAVKLLFKERVKSYSPTTIAFLKEKYPEIFRGDT